MKAGGAWLTVTVVERFCLNLMGEDVMWEVGIVMGGGCVMWEEGVVKEEVWLVGRWMATAIITAKMPNTKPSIYMTNLP